MHRQIAGKLTGRRTKWLVLVFWIAALAVAGPLAGKLTEIQNNEASSWLPASAESTQALERMTPFRDPNQIPTAVVYEREGGLTPQDVAAAQADAEEFATLDDIDGSVQGPIPSEDGEALQTVVTFNAGPDGWNAMPAAAEELREIAERDGVTVLVTGQGGQAADSAEAFEGIDGRLLLAAMSVVVVLLLLTYRSPVLWLLPVISALVALGCAQGTVYLLAEYGDLTVNAQSQGILTVLVFGAGTDYALLLVARYREELRRHEDRHEAMAFALHRAAPAVVASGATVIAGLLCLSLAEMNSISGLGPVTAAGITVGLVVMLTLLPALLVITGRWVFWPFRPAFGSPEPTTSGAWASLGQRIARRPRMVWVGTTVVLAVACLGVLRLEADGLTTEQTYVGEPDSVVGVKALEEHGFTDASNPALIVAEAGSGEAVREAVAGVDGVGPPSPPVEQGGTAFVTATIEGDPTSDAAFETVKALRVAVGEVAGADALVGGGSAILLDTKDASNRDNLVIIPVILVVVLLILIALLRAVLAPLLLMATVVLSFGAALGLSTLIFEALFGFTNVDAGFPLLAFVFLVALGIDYNIFLMTRVREETHGAGTRRAALLGLAATGGVITSAGLVLAGTFLSLATLPVVFLVHLGVAVALGVVIDTFIVRSVLVTALNLDIGPPVWWPSSLDRDGRRSDAPGPDADRRPEPRESQLA